MFQKIVAIDRTGLNDWGKQELRKLARDCVFHDDYPDSEQETAARAQGADCLLVSYHTPVPGRVIRECGSLRYIGMCCSLYSPESANVDVLAARERGIPVTGIYDYGDEGVVEYEVAALINLLHGFGCECWKGQPRELGGFPVGIIGLGAVGIKLAQALRAFGCQLYYHSRTRRPEQEAALGVTYLPLDELLEQCQAVSTHLPKHTILLGKEEFSRLGAGKILLNTSLGPTFEVEALKDWLAQCPDNRYLCDACGMGECEGRLAGVPGVVYTRRGAGGSIQCTQRLSEKVVQNARDFLAKA